MKNYIHVKGARVHNLKNIELKIPRNEFVVVTGVSGSGKSSLAFDTLYAEGQRRYVESLSAYARQFLGRIHKPEVDFIKGIPPAIAIQQKVNTRNPRSTVGTSTEIYDYMKLLFAKIGITYSPISGREVKKHSITHIIDEILRLPDGTGLLLLAPIVLPPERSMQEQLKIYAQQGFSRVINDKKEVVRIDEVEANTVEALVVDRLRISTEKEELRERLGDSLQTAFFEGKGACSLQNIDTGEVLSYSDRFEADGMLFEEPTIHTFNFNNPLGACPVCEGYGKVLGIDPDLVIPDKSLSVYADAVLCWRGNSMQEWKKYFISKSATFDFPVHTAYEDLTESELDLLWNGNKEVEGINNFFEHLEQKKYKIQYRVMLARYRGKTICPECNGTRLKKSASYVKIGGKAISDLVDMPMNKLYTFFSGLELTSYQEKVAHRIMLEITNRLSFLLDVGLSYLTLNRLSNTLSGGESQRINLATSLGSNLVGSLYILDEPSIGLHSKDTQRLIRVLKKLRDLKNTVVVVEHDEEIIRAADRVIDIGPLAGRLGGEVIFNGTVQELHQAETLTGNYLTGKQAVPIPKVYRSWNNYIFLKGVCKNNLKNVSVKFPLQVLTAVVGVSGSGKSTLVREGLTPLIQKVLNNNDIENVISGDFQFVNSLEVVDQNPIGKSSRSNPVTYIKAYDEIRALFASQKRAKYSNLKPAHFSFNVVGGRCEVCQGEGTIQVEMQFMADVRLECEECKGKRFKEEVLAVTYNGKNIFDVLEMTVEEAIVFFAQSKGNSEKKIVQKLQVLKDIGLEYIRLGQSSNTLSGGESQRVKLAYFLSREQLAPSLFIFDEPTTGLHFHDIHKLMNALNALVDRGHSVIVIEHNLDVIKAVDWVIELGPDSGENGGEVIFEGVPRDLLLCEASHTAKFLMDKV